MLFSKLARTLFPVSLFVYLIGLGMAPSAQSISITRNLSWQGTNGITLTGMFTGEDNAGGISDGFIRGTATGINELSFFTITFTDSSNSSSKTYTKEDLLGFSSYNGSTGFLFNYEIATGLVSHGLVSQNADSTDVGFGLSIGDGTATSGYLLESSTSPAPANLTLTDFDFSNNTGGGTLTATPVPFEFEGSAGILTLGAILGVNKWRKNRIKK
jgi:hypothetical protein